MIGLGVDIIEIERIEMAIKKNEHFLTRLFTENELDYIKSKGSKTETVAGLFAAKEAVSKVLGSGLLKFTWQDIEIDHTKLGQPFVILHKGAKDRGLSIGVNQVLLSISHCKTYAIANAMGQYVEGL